MEKVDLAEKLALIRDPWRPKVVAALNGQELKRVKFEGTFVWHCAERACASRYSVLPLSATLAPPPPVSCSVALFEPGVSGRKRTTRSSSSPASSS